jgi:hypothetical protein
VSTGEASSFWKGNRRIVPAAGLETLPSADGDLVALLDAGRPLLLVARNSTSATRAGCRAAAVDLEGAATELLDQYGVDVRGCLPDSGEVAEWLFTTPNKVKSETALGRRFENRFLVLDFRPHAPLVVSVSAGSGLKEDEDFSQPHAAHVRSGLLTKDVAFAGFYAKRFDRLVRSLWSTGQILQSLRALHERHGSAWAADGDGGRWSHDEEADLLFAMRGHGAQTEARNLPRKRARGLMRLTGDHLEHGRVRYPMGSGVPAGFMRYRDRASKQSYLALDSPEYYPDPDTASGYPNVRDRDGNRVDQVENVRWLLANWGLPGKTFAELVEELSDRRFSTEGLRTRLTNGPAAYWGGPGTPGASDRLNLIAPVRLMFTRNLELYEHGRLERTMGDKTAVIEGLVPPGGWATAEDFSRIRETIRAGRERASRRQVWSWTGVPVLVDGNRYRLYARPKALSVDEASSKLPLPNPTGVVGDAHDLYSKPESEPEVLVAWAFDREDEARNEARDEARSGDSARTTDRIPPIPDEVLMTAVVEGLVAADGRPLSPYFDQAGDADARERDEAELARVERDLEALHAEQSHNHRLLTSIDETGSPLLGGALFARVASDYETRAEQIEALESDLARRTALLSAVASTPTCGLSALQMAELVNGLRNPRSNAVRSLLREGVRNLSFKTRMVTGVRDLGGVEVTFTGELVIATKAAAYSIPFAGGYRKGEAFKSEARAARALARLRRGEPRRGLSRGRVVIETKAGAALLGIEPRQFAISNCAEPALLRLGMAVLFPLPGRGENPEDVVPLDSLLDDELLRTEFADVAQLVSNIRSGYEGTRSHQWLRRHAAESEVATILAGWRDPTPVRMKRQVEWFGATLRQRGMEHRWRRTPGYRPVLNPCPWCGSRLAAWPRIREVAGYLCLEPGCRRDNSGVTWPTRFDKYISHPAMYTCAGVELDVPDGFTGSADELRSDMTSPVVATRRGQVRSEMFGFGGSPSAARRARDREMETEIATAYASGRPVKWIMETFGIGSSALYRVVAQAGLEKRGGGGPIPAHPT